MTEQHNPLDSNAISRRRLLAGAGVSGAGLLGAALIGCSTNSPKNGAPSGAASVASATAAASSSKPKRGGIIKYPINQDADSLDPYRSAGSTAYDLVSHVYSRLFTMEPGDGKAASGKVVGDLVKTWEQPDPLTLVLHLDPAAKFDKKEPLNGRQVNANDVVQSWTKFAKDSVYRVDLSNGSNPDAPFSGVEAVDDRTIRFKLKFPDATALSLLGWYEFWVEPSEAIAGKLDLSKEMRGSGPFLLDEYKPAVGLTFSRNPDWFGGPDKPYVDGIKVSIIPDAAQQEVQFRAKNLHFNAVPPQNIVADARDLKDTEIVTTGAPSLSPAWGMSFLPGQPWSDVRVRRAVSMALDRDTFLNVVYKPEQFESVGIKLGRYWNGPIAAGYGAYYLDPKGAEFGPAAAYLKYNPDEATKLLQAAGYSAAKPLVFDNTWPSRYGQDYVQRTEIWQSMLAKVGVKMNSVQMDYATEWIPKYFRAKAEYKGKNVEAAVQYPPGGSAPDALLFYLKYLSVNGASSMTGKYFPAVDDTLRKLRAEPSFEARVAGMKDLQRYATDNMICIPTGPATESVGLTWKALRGMQQYQSWLGSGTIVNPSTLLMPLYWFDNPI